MFFKLYTLTFKYQNIKANRITKLSSFFHFCVTKRNNLNGNLHGKLIINWNIIDLLYTTQRSHQLSRSSVWIEQNSNNRISAPTSFMALLGLTGPLQRGQVANLRPIHVSKQFVWKKCSHLSTLISSPSPNLHRHTAQVSSSEPGVGA